MKLGGGQKSTGNGDALVHEGKGDEERGPAEGRTRGLRKASSASGVNQKLFKSRRADDTRWDKGGGGKKTKILWIAIPCGVLTQDYKGKFSLGGKNRGVS